MRRAHAAIHQPGRRDHAEGLAGGRRDEPDRHAAVTFLLSPAAAYISGTTLKIDGAGALWRKTWEIGEHDQAPPPFHGFAEQ
jgi:hypothetical protein